MALTRDEWNPREDGRKAGGYTTYFPTYKETVWIIRSDWPTANTMARLTIRQYGQDDHWTTIPGRIWLGEKEDDDGA
jgi:hypothetical protein